MVSLKVKIGLGILASYTTYTGYIYIRTQLEIYKRKKLFETSESQDSQKQQQQQQKQQQQQNSSDDNNNQIILSDSDESNIYKTLSVAGRFENPFPEYRPQTLFEFLLTRVLELFEGRTRGGAPKNEKELRELLPIYKPDLELIHSTSQGKQFLESNSVQDNNELPPLCDRLTFTWFGQSCSLVQLSHFTFLTDPLFENYIVSKSMGPRRITPAAAKLDELPIPDFVMVSHDHPDHLEDESVRYLGNKTTWIVPLGVKKFLSKRGIYNVIEMDWWEKVQLSTENITKLSSTSSSTNNNESDIHNTKIIRTDKYEVVCLPSMHWSGRYMADSNSTLWCSFMILKNDKPIFYHAGDTGYSPGLFKYISKKYNNVKLAMLPIGQYCPQWHQKPRHISPEEAVLIMKDLNCHKMLGVHWGTFVLSSEHFLEPKEKLEKIAIDENKKNNILVPGFGRTLIMDMTKMNHDNDDTIKEIRNGKSLVHK
ncbi:hypothetical protein B5S28_g2640 [[Candida] boidinii]|nr:hypothetical protein B5S28_g2640 [[Candida] boidinii]OWB60095.1 hypothetical protein B5S29_g963 [[Candida] boidinii]OWB74845.1 hypothetical protein B5S31_g4674 [[Candida] boidinii]OWB80591.1 hypothetical protein B5S32_g4879 [[Candida] boidinii]